MKLQTGSNKIDLMIGDNVTDDIIVNMDGGVGGSWNGSEVTKLNIAKNLVEKIEDLLDGKAHYYTCCDKKTQHKRIVIEYGHGSNL